MDGGEIGWRTHDNLPTLSEERVAHIFRDAIVGLEYRMFGCFNVCFRG
jgi:hypothetical protein